MKRAEIMTECPEKFENTLKDFIDNMWVDFTLSRLARQDRLITTA